MKIEKIVNIIENSIVIKIKKDVNHLKILIILEIIRWKNMKNAINLLIRKIVMIIAKEVKDVYIAIIMNVIITKTKKVIAKRISQNGKIRKKIIVVTRFIEDA